MTISMWQRRKLHPWLLLEVPRLRPMDTCGGIFSKYACFGQHETGTGQTLTEAYADWKKRVEKKKP